MFILAIRSPQGNSISSSAEVEKLNTLPSWMTGVGSKEIDVVVCEREPNVENYLMGNLTIHNVPLEVCEKGENGRQTKAKYQPQLGLCSTKAMDVKSGRCIEGLGPNILVEWMKQTNHPEFWDRP